MSTIATPTPTPSTAPSTADNTLVALARADARRFARHPLFLAGVGLWVVILGVKVAGKQVVTVGVEDPGTFVAFLVGVFGFVVAHRLTTSLRRSGDLADTTPTSSQSRTLALCLACLVPMTASLLIVSAFIVFGAVWPPTMPHGGSVAWFGYEPDLTILAILLADAVLASLGGPLLGVAVARWAPFRGSALLGMVLLLFVVMSASSLPAPWFAIAPWAIFWNEHLEGGVYQSSWVPTAVSPIWYCGYVACLCGLAVVAALARDHAHRRQLVVAAGVLGTAATGCLVLAAA
jgi:hypothetical protein